jgi:hypothetical protein
LVNFSLTLRRGFSKYGLRGKHANCLPTYYIAYLGGASLLGEH